MVGIFTVPLYVDWLLVSGANIEFDVSAIMLKMFLTLFIPLFVSDLEETRNINFFIVAVPLKTRDIP